VIVGVLLIAVGLALATVTVWFWRTAQPHDPVLGALRIMGDKQFRSADDIARKEMLRQARSIETPPEVR
jgi:hypothetical protein